MDLVKALGVPVVLVLAGTDSAGLWSGESVTATLSVESSTTWVGGWWLDNWWLWSWSGSSWLSGGDHGGWGSWGSWLWGDGWARSGGAGEDSWTWSLVWLQAVVWLSVWAVDGDLNSWVGWGVSTREGDTLSSKGGGSTGDDADLGAGDVELGLSNLGGLVVS